MSKIRVVVVDDSALVRSLLSAIINRQSDMECIGTANDPLAAREMIRALDPDVITLDIEMPKMDGLEFLGRLMRLRPMPVIMISTLTERGAEATMRALELGAVDFVAKPRIGLTEGINELAGMIVDKIRVAARAQVRRIDASVGAATPAGGAGAASVPVKTPSAAVVGRYSTEKLIAIGASTGGTEAIKEILMAMPADAPGIVITQHMPAGFTSSFAARLDSLCALAVQEATDGSRILPGHVYIAPGGRQLRVQKSGANYICVVDDSEPVNRHKPSVEVLFQSVAQVVGPNAYGIMLTGMGADGAQAMREMRDAGSYNFVQDEASCVVFGMPREAIEHGAADEILALQSIAPALLRKLAASADRYRI